GGERFAPVDGSVNATVRGAPTAELIACTRCEMLGSLRAPAVDGLVWRRRVRVADGRLEIDDSWTLACHGELSLLWLFDPAWRVEGLDGSSVQPAARVDFRLVGKERAISARLEGGDLHVFRSRESYSPDYGRYEACDAVGIDIAPGRHGRLKFSLA